MRPFVANVLRFFIPPTLFFILFTVTSPAWAAIIADHSTTDITAVPQSAIENAKTVLHIAYGHTSHGSQLTTGMTGLVGFANNGGLGLSLPADIFAWNNGGVNGALDLHDGAMGGDVGYYPQWVDNTRAYLGTPNASGCGANQPDVNVVIWSWCGQASGRTAQEMIDTYLAPMAQLESDYPGVTFVYMTGHADGSGEAGNLHLRNQQIRDYCVQNNKVLYDFYDIECYDPDGIYYGDKLVNDNCDYDSDGNGSRDANWAVDWQNSHTQDVDWYSCYSTHSQPLNANRKAYAAWWLWARLGGWGDCAPAPGNLTATPDAQTGAIMLSWADTSENEDGFIIDRRIDSAGWDIAYATVGAGITTLTDTQLFPGTYHYRVSTYRSDDGSGNPCSSGASNTVSVVLPNIHLPAMPSGLTAVADSVAGEIALAWTDNADNEDAYFVHRRVDGGIWDTTYASLGADSSAYLDDNSGAGLPGGTYEYRIVAANTYGQSTPSNPATGIIANDPPAAPGALYGELSGLDAILVWADNSQDEENFIVERSNTGASADFSEVASLGADVTTWTDTAVEPYHTYYYRVLAANNMGYSAPSNVVSLYADEEQVTVVLNNAGAGEVADAFMNSATPDTNYGATSYTTRYDRFIVRFNLPSEILNKHIISANLSFYVWAVDASDAGALLDIYAVGESWDESAVTWNTASNNLPWTTAGGALDNVVGQMAVKNIDHAFLTPLDVTALVQQWADGTRANYGILLDKGPSIGMGIKASEYSQNASPYLEITYTNSKQCTDFDGDGDVDGLDLSHLSTHMDVSCLAAFCDVFGQ